jgi:hypothetical protein
VTNIQEAEIHGMLCLIAACVITNPWLSAAFCVISMLYIATAFTLKRTEKLSAKYQSRTVRTPEWPR